jgi:hypothetical protein
VQRIWKLIALAAVALLVTSGAAHAQSATPDIHVDLTATPAAPQPGDIVTFQATPQLAAGQMVLFYTWVIDGISVLDIPADLGKIDVGLPEGEHEIVVFAAVVGPGPLGSDTHSGTGVLKLTVGTPPPAPTPVPTATPTPVPTPAPDVTPPTATAKFAGQKRRDALTHGLRLKLACSEFCTADLDLTLDAKSARRLGLGHKALAAGHARVYVTRSRTLQITLSRRVRNALKRSRHSATLKLSGTVLDLAGNVGRLPAATATVRR